jgi:pimeloyl-ACP methyl ester carboxylesterase
MTEIANLNGFEMRFEIHGEGIPIVYTPGGFWPLERGRAVAERLKSLGYKVLLWDRPNTGESGLWFQGENLLGIWADKLHELLHYAGHSPTFLAGGSGGYLASLYFAYVYPAEVKGLILISPQTDDQEIWGQITNGTFRELAEVAEQQGMAAVVERAGGMCDFFEWPDQFERLPQKKQQLLSMSPVTFAETMRSWAHSLTIGGRPYFAALTDEQLAGINIPAIVFSGMDDLHPPHTARALHDRLPMSELVITSEYYADRLDEIRRESEEKGGEYFDVAQVDRMDEFVRSILQGQ